MKNGHWKLINRATLPHEQDDIELIDKAWSDMGVIHAKPPRNAVPQGFVSTLLGAGIVRTHLRRAFLCSDLKSVDLNGHNIRI